MIIRHNEPLTYPTDQLTQLAPRKVKAGIKTLRLRSSPTKPGSAAASSTAGGASAAPSTLRIRVGHLKPKAAEQKEIWLVMRSPQDCSLCSNQKRLAVSIPYLLG